MTTKDSKLSREAKKSPPQNQKQSATGRRSSRNRRRRRNKQGGGQQQQGSRLTRPLVAPMSVDYSSQTPVYLKRTGTPKHKEWGEGIRYTGVSILGSLRTTGAANTVLLPYYPQIVTAVDASQYYYDIYAIDAATVGLCYTMHPSQLMRLSQECYNWGRYCFRKLKVWTEPVGSATNVDGYSFAVSHNVTWPLNEAVETGIDSLEIRALQPSATRSFWDPACVQVNDYSGEKTWSCDRPISQLGIGDKGDTFWGPYVEDFYQYFTVFRTAGGNAVNTLPFLGFVMFEYEIDFYSSRNVSEINMGAMIFASETLDSSSKSSSSSITSGTSSERKSVPSTKPSWSSKVGSYVRPLPPKPLHRMLHVGRLRPTHGSSEVDKKSEEKKVTSAPNLDDGLLTSSKRSSSKEPIPRVRIEHRGPSMSVDGRMVMDDEDYPC